VLSPTSTDDAPSNDKPYSQGVRVEMNATAYPG